MTLDQDRYAPVLDLLRDHHERRGHQGPAEACVAPECWDARQCLKHPTEQTCSLHDLTYGCTSCEGWTSVDVMEDELDQANSRHEELAKAIRFIKGQCQDALEEFAEEYAR